MSLLNRGRAHSIVSAGMDLVGRQSDRGLLRGIWRCQHFRPRLFIKGIIRPPALLYDELSRNLITNAGLDELLDVGLSHAATQANWYMALKDTGAPAAGDTMASHAGWATISPYSNANDPEWSDAGVSSQSVDNSGSTADFTINETDEVFGAFLKDNNTVDSSSGLLFSSTDFGASRNVISGDTLKVTATFTMADS